MRRARNSKSMHHFVRGADSRSGNVEHVHANRVYRRRKSGTRADSRAAGELGRRLKWSPDLRQLVKTATEVERVEDKTRATQRKDRGDSAGARGNQGAENDQQASLRVRSPCHQPGHIWN
jgi:hypothetical protein